MTCMMVVSVSVRSPDLGDPARDIELGAFGSAWIADGVLIGSDPRCDVVLPELPAVAARVKTASNHRFDLGPYSIRFGEIRRAA